jgi:hypothetical protein
MYWIMGLPAQDLGVRGHFRILFLSVLDVPVSGVFFRRCVD